VWGCAVPTLTCDDESCRPWMQSSQGSPLQWGHHGTDLGCSKKAPGIQTQCIPKPGSVPAMLEGLSLDSSRCSHPTRVSPRNSLLPSQVSLVHALVSEKHVVVRLLLRLVPLSWLGITLSGIGTELGLGP
jgi:hypothetical protein